MYYIEVSLKNGEIFVGKEQS